MPWQLSALFYVIFSSVRSVQIRRIGLNKTDLTPYALLTSFVCILVGGICFGVIYHSTVSIDSAISALPFLIIGGCLFAVVNVLAIKLFRYVPASVGVFMSLLNTVAIILLAYIFAHETLSVKEWLGTVILMVTIIMIALITKTRKNIKVQKSLMFGYGIALLTALLLGPALLNEKYLISRLGLETYLVFGWGFQAIFSIFIAIYFIKKQDLLSGLNIRTHLNVWLYGVLLLFSGFSFVLSLKNSGSLSLLAVTGTASVVVTVIMAYLILDEHEHIFIKITGLILTGIGLTLLFT